jgi:hypothetical protein
MPSGLRARHRAPAPGWFACPDAPDGAAPAPFTPSPVVPGAGRALSDGEVPLNSRTDHDRSEALSFVTLRAQPPRDVRLDRLWLGAFERGRLPAAAAALTAAFAMFEWAAGRDARLALSLTHALPLGLASGAALCWGGVAASLWRNQRLLVHGRLVVARVVAVSVADPRAARHARRVRLAYAGEIEGLELRGTTTLVLHAGASQPASGERLALLCDPANPRRHLVPLAHGFSIEGT